MLGFTLTRNFHINYRKVPKDSLPVDVRKLKRIHSCYDMSPAQSVSLLGHFIKSPQSSLLVISHSNLLSLMTSTGIAG